MSSVLALILQVQIMQDDCILVSMVTEFSRGLPNSREINHHYGTVPHDHHLLHAASFIVDQVVAAFKMLVHFNWNMHSCMCACPCNMGQFTIKAELEV